jgi:D-3-phosphoglycerate dehydrogenase / 2-oxoglutarate reductase
MVMARFKVLLTDKIDAAGIEILEKVAEVKFSSSLSEDVLTNEASDVDGMIVRVPAFVTRKVLENARRLKVVGRFGVGYENIDVEAATEKGVVVTYTPGANTLSVAEHVIGLMFALAKQITQTDNAVRRQDWEMRLKYSGIELAGKTLGLVGLGRIGTCIAGMARGLGMSVLVFDPYVGKERAGELGVELLTLEPLLSRSDFIVICCALTDETRGLIGEKALTLLKPTAYLVNVARGPIVDEQALIKALRDKRIAGAALDVFEKEPPDPNNPLLKLENVILSPHIAGVAQDASRRISVWVAEDVVRVLNREPPKYPVNPQVLQG